jgi:hypothetical protein
VVDIFHHEESNLGHTHVRRIAGIVKLRGDTLDPRATRRHLGGNWLLVMMGSFEAQDFFYKINKLLEELRGNPDLKIRKN